ncbi:DMT family transporter [Vibrio mexicanus]|uniref:DMT family transporter n=1 Tax=Vibrio mexicanus TaxID=1004326 RepID=UPI00063C09D1|nr:DMT family transporter [Vibrio mexicanus]
MMYNFSATHFMLLSTLSLSANGVLAKLLAQYASLNPLVFFRLLLPALFMLGTAFVLKHTFYNKNLLKPIVVRAFCIAGCQWCFLYALAHLSLIESVVLFATGPLFIPVVEKLFFATRLPLRNLIALVTTFIGVLFLAGDVTQISLRSELLVGLMAGVFNAGAQVSLYRASKSNLSPIVVNGWVFLLGSMLIVPVMMLSGTSADDFSFATAPTEHGLIWLGLCLLALATISNQVFRSKAYKLATSNTQVAPLIFTNLLFSLVWQLLFFDDSMSVQKAVGVCLIIFANVMLVFSAKWPRSLKAAKA